MTCLVTLNSERCTSVLRKESGPPCGEERAQRKGTEDPGVDEPSASHCHRWPSEQSPVRQALSAYHCDKGISKGHVVGLWKMTESGILVLNPV